MIHKENKSYLQLAGFCVALSFLFSTCATPFVEASLWNERREAAKSLKDTQSTLISQLPEASNAAIGYGRHSGETCPDLSGSRNLANIISILDSPFGRNDVHVKSLSWTASLPINIASLRKASIPNRWKAGDPIVLYVQDAHLNKDAQENIGKTIQHFIDAGKIDWVALEGAFGPIDISPFRQFEDQKVVRKVADYMLKSNKISGAIHTAFTSPKEIPPFIGVDDKDHYWANVNAYRESFPKVSSYKEKLSKLINKLQQEKAEHFDSELLTFDTQIEAYREGKLKLGNYLQLLSKYDSPSFPRKKLGTVPSGTVPNFSQVRAFLETLRIEQSLDFTQVEKERASIIEKLVKTLSRPQMQDLLNASLSYRLGNIQHADFYLYVKELAKRNDILFSEFPAMQSYLSYLIASDKLNGEKLFEEVSKLEENIYSALAKSEEEIRLVKESKHLYLLGKLINSSLTRQEWDQYVKLGTAPYLHANRELSLISFENFYKESIIRDQKIASNLIRNVKEKKAQVALLVAGGFHSDGIEAELHKNNIAVISYTPKIAKVDTTQGTEYLSAFTQEKTPLQKLFDGDKLFVAPEVFSNSAKFESALADSVLGSKSPKQIDPNFDKLVGNDQFDILAVEGKDRNMVVTVQGPQGALQTTIQQAGDSISSITQGEVIRISWRNYLSTIVKNLFEKINGLFPKRIQRYSTAVLVSIISACTTSKPSPTYADFPQITTEPVFIPRPSPSSLIRPTPSPTVSDPPIPSPSPTISPVPSPTGTPISFQMPPGWDVKNELPERKNLSSEELAVRDELESKLGVKIADKQKKITLEESKWLKDLLLNFDPVGSVKDTLKYFVFLPPNAYNSGYEGRPLNDKVQKAIVYFTPSGASIPVGHRGYFARTVLGHEMVHLLESRFPISSTARNKLLELRKESGAGDYISNYAKINDEEERAENLSYLMVNLGNSPANIYSSASRNLQRKMNVPLEHLLLKDDKFKALKLDSSNFNVIGIEEYKVNRGKDNEIESLSLIKTLSPLSKLIQLLREEEGQGMVEYGVIFGVLAGLGAPALLLVAGAAVGVSALVIYLGKKAVQKVTDLIFPSPEKEIAQMIVTAIMALISGKEVDAALFFQSINTILARASLSRDIQVLDGSNSLLQAFEHLDKSKLKTALHAEFKKRSNGKLTEEQAERAATAVIYHADGSQALSKALSSIQLNENRLVGAILDPKKDAKESAQATIEEFRKTPGSDKATLAIAANHLTDSQMKDIQLLAEGLNVEIRTHEDLFMESRTNESVKDINPLILETLLKDVNASSKFTAFGLIIPEALMTNLTRILEVMGSDPSFNKQDSILYKASIILIDETFRARPPQKFLNLEQIQKLAHIIAQQA